jgi:hypothetical protein
MALTSITTGMEKGPEAIDANFKALDANMITKIDWTETGITYLNGFSRNSDIPLKYAVVDLGNNTRMIGLTGWIKAGRLNWASSAVGIKIPTSIFKSGNYTLSTEGTIFPWNDLLISYNMNKSTGEITFQNKAGRNDTIVINAGDDYQIHMIFIQ